MPFPRAVAAVPFIPNKPNESPDLGLDKPATFHYNVGNCGAKWGECPENGPKSVIQWGNQNLCSKIWDIAALYQTVDPKIGAGARVLSARLGCYSK